MVRRRILACALSGALAGAPAHAQPDWGAAGGAIFAERDAGPAAAAATRDATVQLPPSAQPLDAIVAAAATRHRIDPKLLHALVTVESAYHPAALSRAGAVGLTQLMPATARDLGVGDPLDPVANLQGGADYLARQLLRFGDVKLALAAYNSGPGRVAAAGRVPSISETQIYVEAVVACFLALSAGRAVRTASDCRGRGR